MFILRGELRNKEFDRTKFFYSKVSDTIEWRVGDIHFSEVYLNIEM